MAYNNKKLFWFLLLIFLILGLFCFEFFFRPLPAVSVVSKNISPLRTGSVYLKDIKLRVEIAQTREERFRGLSGYKNLCENCAMLFNFETKENQNFVMRNMNFPLDIIFINDGRIINIASDLSPEGFNPSKIYPSYGEVNQVLEVNGGFCSKYGIKVGDSIKNLEID